MSIVESLMSLLSKKGPANETETPKGICPNCWGRTEYGGQFFEAAKNEGVDVNNPSTTLGWVQDYANKHLVGIQLQKENEGMVCQKCKVTYRPD